MTLFTESPNEFIKILLDFINKFCSAIGYKINAQNQ